MLVRLAEEQGRNREGAELDHMSGRGWHYGGDDSGTVSCTYVFKV